MTFWSSGVIRISIFMQILRNHKLLRVVTAIICPYCAINLTCQGLTPIPIYRAVALSFVSPWIVSPACRQVIGVPVSLAFSLQHQFIRPNRYFQSIQLRLMETSIVSYIGHIFNYTRESIWKLVPKFFPPFFNHRYVSFCSFRGEFHGKGGTSICNVPPALFPLTWERSHFFKFTTLQLCCLSFRKFTLSLLTFVKTWMSTFISMHFNFQLILIFEMMFQSCFFFYSESIFAATIFVINTYSLKYKKYSRINLFSTSR